MLSFILAILALSFLIFIHELGHYLMAKKVKMKVEVFSVGFGRPIFKWKSGETSWQIGWLPFGGYVKIAGTDSDKLKDLYSVIDGFFGKSPWDRIKVAFMGPLVNLVFALVVFSLVWINGGREKPFSDYTHKVGLIDKESELYQKGVRPGDEISSYDGVIYSSSKDHLFYPLIADKTLRVEGSHVNYSSLEKTPFTFDVGVKPSALSAHGIPTSGILAPASFIIYDPKGAAASLPEGSPMKGSGIQPKDRLVWLDGHLLFSLPELSSLLNDDRILVTVQRGNQFLLRRVPRAVLIELRLDPSVREELVDWQYEAGLQGKKLEELYAFPYNLTNDGVIEERLRLIDKDMEAKVFPQTIDSQIEEPLLPKDKIVAISGKSVDRSYQILKEIQQKSVLLIVDRSPILSNVVADQSDRYFDNELHAQDILAIEKTIGTKDLLRIKGDKVLLSPIVPVPLQDFAIDPERKALLEKEWMAARKEVEASEEGERRAQLLSLIDSRFQQKVLGLPEVTDISVIYNPIPSDMYLSVIGEIRRTLGALFSGHLSPKWLSGPVGIVTVVQKQGMISLNDALYWLGAISLNLGLLNLLPIPMLDGGTILLSLFEWVTGIKLSPKTMERVILPFAFLLLAFFVFVTYHDILRLFKF